MHPFTGSLCFKWFDFYMLVAIFYPHYSLTKYHFIMRSEVIKSVLIDKLPLVGQIYNMVMTELGVGHSGINFHVEEAKCFDSGIALLDGMSDKAVKIDLVLLDVNISPLEICSCAKGREIGLNIRARFPEARILAKLDLKNNFQINRILQSVKPEGFLIMTDVDLTVLKSAIKDVLYDPPFYSKSVLRSLRKSNGHNFALDEWDELLLYELSLGNKMRDFPSVIPLGLTTIEKRKQNIKSLFGVTGKDNKELLEKAREYGII